MSRVAIIGAGLAGCAAAITLAQQGVHHVSLFEAGPIAGGRARRVVAKLGEAEVALDNGLHILIGAYSQTLRLMREIGVNERDVLLRQPLQLALLGRAATEVEMRAPFSNALGLGIAMLGATGLSLADRWAMLRFMARLKFGAVDHSGTVRELLTRESQPPRLNALLWEPLCVATLNTVAQDASASVFAQVLHDALLGPAGASDLLLPKADLSALLPEPACAWLTARGHQVRLATRISAIAKQDAGFELSFSAQGEVQREQFDRVILATAPREAAALLAPFEACHALGQTLQALTYRSIHSVYLQYPHAVQLPCAMTGLASPPHQYAQWVFDREQLAGQRGMIGVVISDSQVAKPLTQDELVTVVHHELRAALGGAIIKAEPVASKVIQEKFATFACTPNAQRPVQQTPIDGLYLAGDYTVNDASPIYPATIEGAVRSGIFAAQFI
jgi:hydroxysqualene dehydroxylase